MRDDHFSSAVVSPWCLITTNDVCNKAVEKLFTAIDLSFSTAVLVMPSHVSAVDQVPFFTSLMAFSTK